MQPNAYKTFRRLICCQLCGENEDDDRFKPASSIASSKAPSESRSSRISSGVRSVGNNSSFGRNLSTDPEVFDQPNPIFMSSSSFQQDDWYEDEDVSIL